MEGGFLRLRAHPEPSVYVDVHRSSLTDAVGVRGEFDTSVRPSGAGPVLDLLGQRVVKASESEGVLTIRFDSGSELQAFPDRSYESWTVASPEGRVFQWMPGGEVASW